MTEPSRWLESSRNELQQATAARAAGNEGRARVCSRRAAGHIAGEYLRRQGLNFLDPSAYSRLRYLLTLPGLPPTAAAAAAYLMARLTPEFTHPDQADLIAETRILAQGLLGEDL